MPIGTLTVKIQCQSTDWTSAPPSSRPSEPPEVTTNMYAPMAFTRSSTRGKSVAIRARITEVAIAPPKPWRNRAAISASWDSASPQASEATVKMAVPARNTRLRPRRSPRRPASSRKLP